MTTLPRENVWDYPRPPRLERCPHRVRVIHRGQIIADSERAYRVLETSHPPTYYIPREDVAEDRLLASSRRSFCEFKGQAHYVSLVIGDEVVKDVAWFYPEPTHGFEAIKNHLAFYANKVDACFVGDEQVIPQPGDFYGGWVTSNLEGPIKGAPGSGSVQRIVQKLWLGDVKSSFSLVRLPF